MAGTVAIIPARGGSKRIPGKNLMDFMGEPLLAHSIRFALDNLKLLDEIAVSTDDPEIKKVAQHYGVKVINRPPELATDTATTASVLQHAIGEMPDSDNVVLLQVTNPLRPTDLLKDAMKAYVEMGADSLITVTPNLQKLGRISEGRFQPYNYRFGQRSQDMEPLFYENGLLYITRSSLIKQGKILGDHNHPFVVNHPFGTVDIDEEEDLSWAEFVWRRYYER